MQGQQAGQSFWEHKTGLWGKMEVGKEAGSVCSRSSSWTGGAGGWGEAGSAGQCSLVKALGGQDSQIAARAMSGRTGMGCLRRD